jgi:hypothetical protein
MFTGVCAVAVNIHRQAATYRYNAFIDVAMVNGKCREYRAGAGLKNHNLPVTL